MTKRRRFEQIRPLEERLSVEAKRLREEAKLLPAGALGRLAAQGSPSRNWRAHKRMVEISRPATAGVATTADLC